MASPKKEKKDSVSTKAVIWILLGFLALIGALAWLSGCSGMKDYPPDNVVEEVAEAALDYYIGVDLDFTPLTPE